MKNLLKNTNVGIDEPWVTLDIEGVVHYMPTVTEITFTFGSVESHTKAKADAVVGDICYVGNTPIGVVVIKGDESVKIMSLFDLKEDGTDSTDNNATLTWGTMGVVTNVTDENNGKANTAALVALGSDYKAAVACSLYSTKGTSKGDWYLPAKKELNQIGRPIYEIKDVLSILMNMSKANNLYNTIWTSTECNNGNQSFYMSVLQRDANWPGNKTGQYSVRAFCEL